MKKYSDEESIKEAYYEEESSYSSDEYEYDEDGGSDDDIIDVNLENVRKKSYFMNSSYKIPLIEKISDYLPRSSRKNKHKRTNSKNKYNIYDNSEFYDDIIEEATKSIFDYDTDNQTSDKIQNIISLMSSIASSIAPFIGIIIGVILFIMYSSGGARRSNTLRIGF
uniref:Transmembrane protein n=1 Tax=Pithovirus LCPAC101 TaxID=2506586 RepID=A0A481Z2E9_9VIRU|nr:MAG: hypothetical protein LCPAC101_02200 [Pithovirus LCPAC101]